MVINNNYNSYSMRHNNQDYSFSRTFVALILTTCYTGVSWSQIPHHPLPRSVSFECMSAIFKRQKGGTSGISFPGGEKKKKKKHIFPFEAVLFSLPWKVRKKRQKNKTASCWLIILEKLLPGALGNVVLCFPSVHSKCALISGRQP